MMTTTPTTTMATAACSPAADFRNGQIALADAARNWQAGNSRLPKLIGLNDRLLAATSATDSPPGPDPVDWTSVIKACDRFYCVSAGETAARAPSHPLWFTRLEAPPNQFSWTSDSFAPWTFRLQLAARDLLWTADGAGTDFQLPVDWIKAIQPGDRWRWTVSADVTSPPVARGAFELVRGKDAVAIDVPVDGANSEVATVFFTIAAAIEAELFQKASALWEALSIETLSAIDQFVAHRLMALLFRKMAQRLTGPPLWMGEPEGLLASELSRQHLARGWTALGMTVNL